MCLLWSVGNSAHNWMYTLSDIEMPDFNESFFKGYSDHTIGTSACIYAISKGAKYVEKHFTTNKATGSQTEMAHVCSMDFNDLNLLIRLANIELLDI